MTRRTTTYYSNSFATLYAEFNRADWDEVCEMNGINISDFSDNEKWEYVYENDRIYFQDFVSELNEIKTNLILAVGTVGTWRGSRSAYKEIDSMAEIPYIAGGSCDEITFFSDGYNLCFSGNHHDGSNYITFREVKEDISEEVYARMLDAIYNDADNKDYYIKTYTRSLLPKLKSYPYFNY